MVQIFCPQMFPWQLPNNCSESECSIYEERVTVPHCTKCDRDERENERERVSELLSGLHSRGSNSRALSLRSRIEIALWLTEPKYIN